MKKSENSGLLDVEKLEFSASAYELAIAMQLRMLEAESSGHKSRQLRENKHRMMRIRGLLEDIVRSDDVVIEKSLGLELQRHHTWLEETLDDEGRLRRQDMAVYLDKATPREK